MLVCIQGLSFIHMISYIIKKILIVTAMLLLSTTMLSGCLQNKQPTSISFQPVYENIALSCDNSFKQIVTGFEQEQQVKQWQYQQLQFFIHNVEVRTKSNGWQPWLMTKKDNQADGVALLGEVCNESKVQNHWQLELQPLSSSAVITNIRFTLGVPFVLNHLNPLTQPSPLNDSSMFWGWQGGHKFMRAELVSANDDWLFHLGSTGCKALSPVRAPKSECLYPNRVVVSLPFSEQDKAIEFNLAALIGELALTRKNSCQSSVDEDSCKVLFNNLAISESGKNISQIFKAISHD